MTLPEKITLNNYWEAIHQLLKRNGVPDKTVKKIENEIVDSLLGKNEFQTEEIYKKLSGVTQNAAAIVTLADAIMRLWK